MRFPLVGGEAERMVVAAVEAGGNDFDTAYAYPGNEKALGNILAKNGLRDKVFLATKMPLSSCKKYEDFDRIFDEQKRRLKTDFVDYYLMHNIIGMGQWEAAVELGIERWIQGKIESGEIRQIGFSYHGSGEEFPRVVDAYEWDFCMIQLNYYDINYQAGLKGLKYAAAKGLPVIIMEPLLGGKLATGLPKKAVQIFREKNPDRHPAEWALHWLWNLPEVTVVLSGMTSEKILRANLKSLEDFQPLSDTEVYDKVVENFRRSYKVKCTGCNYCLPCPKGIDIPARFTAYNTSYAQGFFTGMVMYMTAIGLMGDEIVSVRNCNACGKCEKACPQNIPIRAGLKKVGKRFESLPFRVMMKIVRSIMR
jgi:predicted aldo/keto reductase-like oxidoreductase